MITLIEILTIILIFLLLTLEILLLLNKFKRLDLLIYLIIPLIIFVSGFSLRLSDNKQFIDLGFYFTEVSNLFLFLLFVLALFLGQVRYWKK